jgi:hypothetical protein
MTTVYRNNKEIRTIDSIKMLISELRIAPNTSISIAFTTGTTYKIPADEWNTILDLVDFKIPV